MAEEKHDLLDDIIDIRRDLQGMSNPLDSFASAFDPDAETAVWDPSVYKFRPSVSSTKCARILADDASVCRACLDVCPVDAISFEGGKLSISDSCRMCGLCIPACPGEAFRDAQHFERRFYDEIVRRAASHNTCYITCTRALGRFPAENEYVLPCVGILSPELLFSVLVEYPNVSVYLPMGICDRCRTTTGEEAYVAHIGDAETWSGRAVGLAMDEEELDHTKKRSYERSEFVDSLVGGARAAAMAANPVLAGAAAITKTLSDHTKKINALERSLDKIVGSSTTQKKRRMLSQRRQLVMGVLQKMPGLAERIPFSIPECDATRCTSCGDCVRACPYHACDLDADGRFTLASVYCVGCRACEIVCPEDALTMVAGDPADLVVPDKDAQIAAERDAKRKEQIEQLKSEGRKRVMKGLQMLEKLAPDEE